VQEPIVGLEGLRIAQQIIDKLQVEKIKGLPFSGSSYEISFSMQPAENAVAGIRIAVGGNRYFEIGYNQNKSELYIDRSHTFNSFNTKYASIAKSATVLPTKDGKIGLRVFMDASIVEVYSADGTVVFTSQVFPENTDRGIQLFSEGAVTNFQGIRFWQMKAIR